MPDDWRDKLAALVLDDKPVRLAMPRSPGKTQRMAKQAFEFLRDNPDAIIHQSAPLISSLERDELYALQSAALDDTLKATGRTIRHPHEQHADRQARLRGIPAIGSVGGAMKGTRPDHA